MKSKYQFCRDTRGSTAIEFGFTAPIFFTLIVGIMAIGLVLWQQYGLEHGAEMAARCASIDKKTCNSTAAIQAFAVAETFGIKPDPSAFVVSTQACGIQVSATYRFTLLTHVFGVPSLDLSAQYCFPS
jgi:Flp pilus assembly protein TadG